MRFKALVGHRFFRPVLGAATTILCGLLLWKAPWGEPWVNASYDYLFPFGSHTVTNDVVLIVMDNAAFAEYHQSRDLPWDREFHAKLLRKLGADDCALVVFDSFFRSPGDVRKDQALVDAMRQVRHMVLMSHQAEVTHPMMDGAYPTPPDEEFLNAAGTNCGVAWLDPDLDRIVRRHWPSPVPGPYASLPWTAARIAGARLDDLEEHPRELWLRYYGRERPWTTMSYRFALGQTTNYFRNRIVFIGTQPATSLAGDEKDEFQTPYWRWTGETTGGVEINATAFLNLMNHDWLERPPRWTEVLILIITGALLGSTLCRTRPLTAGVVGAAVLVVVTVGAVWFSFHTSYWFPWLVIVGGQLPIALLWALLMPAFRRVQETVTDSIVSSRPDGLITETPPKFRAVHELPDTPDYELINPPFGGGAYGNVWLARNAIGQWQALKVIYLKNFDNNSDPYDREFNGISRYKPVSDKHPGLLRIDFVSKKRNSYFYYVMELGDSLEPGWERNPPAYKPRDLISERARAPGKRLPVHECIRIGLELTEALEFLHRQGLTHRDIKPQNIIFVNDRPKLADVGLTAEIRPIDQERTFVGTPGYMPPPPEPPGTPQADIYALGMVLYVMSTGRNTGYFPEISTTLISHPNPVDFLPLNTVILKACHPDCKQRFASAAEMHRALEDARKALDRGSKPGG
jgi:CHASE2 domain-containing sensor protein